MVDLTPIYSKRWRRMTEVASDVRYGAAAALVDDGVPFIARGLCAGHLTSLAEIEAAVGDATAPVELEGPGGYGARRRITQTVRDYLHGLCSGPPSKTAAAAPASPPPLAYLKDFHLVLAGGGGLYQVPRLFCDDALNAYYHHAAVSVASSSADSASASASGSAGASAVVPDDYRFLYVGPAGSSTGLHHDVLASHSWSANVTGAKLWLMLSPAASQPLYNAWQDLTTHDVRTAEEVAACEQAAARGVLLPAATSDADTGAADGGSSSSSSSGGDLQWCVQGPADAVFVPAGWHHQVYNLPLSSPHTAQQSVVASINHNWISSTSLPVSWRFLQRELATIRVRLADSRTLPRAEDYDAEHEAVCQTVLKANASMDLQQFGVLLLLHAHKLVRAATAAAATAAAATSAADNAVEEGMWDARLGEVPHLPPETALRAALPRQQLGRALTCAHTVLQELLQEPWVVARASSEHPATPSADADGGVVQQFLDTTSLDASWSAADVALAARACAAAIAALG